jgi:hypothetical protein
MQISIRKITDVNNDFSSEADIVHPRDVGAVTALGNQDIHVGSFDGSGSDESPRTIFTQPSGKTILMGEIADKVLSKTSKRSASFAFVGASRPGGKPAVYVIEKPPMHMRIG